MKIRALVTGVVAVAMMPVAAQADDPHDPAMRNAAARARDSEKTRELNRRENQRLVRTGVRWHVVRPGSAEETGDDGYAAAMRDHDRDMAQYRRDRARYDQEMAEWRRAVAACRAGDDDACDN